MAKHIAASMVDWMVEVGDLVWSARSAKTGWLKCEGQAVSRSSYSALFIAIGVAFGMGDGATTFNVPDGRGRALVGAGAGPSLTNRALGATGGAETHVLSAAEIPAHTHPMKYLNLTYTSGAGTMVGALGSGGLTANTDANTGGGSAHNNMQPFVAANLFIYTGI